MKVLNRTPLLDKPYAYGANFLFFFVIKSKA
jgi:hypothetical protein